MGEFPGGVGGWGCYVGGVGYFLDGGVLLTIIMLLSINCMRTRRTGSVILLALSGTLRVTLDRGPAVGITNRRVRLGGRTGGRTCNKLFPRISLANSCSQALGGRAVIVSFNKRSRAVRMNSSGSCGKKLGIDLPMFTPALCGDVGLAGASIRLTIRGTHSSGLSLIGRIAGTCCRLLLTRSDCGILLRDCTRTRTGCRIIGTGCRRKAIDRCSGVHTSMRIHDLGPSMMSTNGKIGLTHLRLRMLVNVSARIRVTTSNGLGSCRVIVFHHRVRDGRLGLGGGDSLGRLSLGTSLLGGALTIRQAGFVPALTTSFGCSCASLGGSFGVSRCG